MNNLNSNIKIILIGQCLRKQVPEKKKYINNYLTSDPTCAQSKSTVCKAEGLVRVSGILGEDRRDGKEHGASYDVVNTVKQREICYNKPFP
jgi:hypothetical protein